MAFDFKKEYKEYYLLKDKPAIVDVPAANFLAVRGKGDPNETGGAYSRALQLLYAVAYTLRMSYKGSYHIEGYYEYVVPPLEGFWWQEGIQGMDYARKDKLHFVSLLRLPDFIREQDVEWAKAEAAKKKKLDCGAVEFFHYDEGLCVQCMHIGSYDTEPATVEVMTAYAKSQGYAIDISDTRHHHEIYISDPRKVEAAQCKTVLRHPLKKLQ